MSWETRVIFCRIPNYALGNGSELWFNTREECDSYFMEKKIATLEYDKTSYVRLEGGQFRVKKNCDELTNLAPNFVIFKNTNFNNRWIIANIMSLSYISPNVTEVGYATNAWLTWFDLLDLNMQSYIVRRTFSKNDDDKRISQLPFEDLDIGETYLVSDTVFDYNGSGENFNDNQFYYLLMTKPLTKTGSTHSILTGEQTSKLVENDVEKTITTTNGINSILYGYVMNYTCFNACVERGLFSTDCDFVNALQLVLELPFGRDIFPTELVNIYQEISTSSSPDFGATLPATSECYNQEKFGKMYGEVNLTDWGSHLNDYINKCLKDDFTLEYDNSFNESAISKYLRRYPYSLVEIYDFYNQPLTIAPENVNRINPYKMFRDRELNVYKFGSIGQNPMLVYGLKGYGNMGTNDKYNQAIESGDSIYNKMNMNLNTIQSTINLPIISNYLSSFLQSNQNQINAQRVNLRDSLQTQINNAGSTMQATALSIAMQQRNAVSAANVQAKNDIANNQTVYNVMKNNANTELDNTMLSVTATAMGGMAGAIGTGISGNFMGALGAAAGTGMRYGVGSTQAANSYMNAIKNASMTQASNNAIANNVKAASLQAARNTANAQAAAANANYANTLRSSNTAYTNAMRSLNSRLQDAKNIPDSVQSMGNNASIFNLMTNRDFIKYSTKTLVPEVMERLIDYFVRLGFLTNRNEKLSDIFKRFDSEVGFYIQTLNANIGGNIPTDMLSSIIGMFDSGVHFWRADNYLDYESMREV